jgi:hypothetical protein
VQSALIAETNVKFRSNLIPADQSIVEIVGQKEDGHVASVTRRLRKRIVLTIFCFFHIFKQQKLRFSAFSSLMRQKFLFQAGQMLHG